MKRNNYIHQLTQENFLLKIKINELHNNIQELKSNQEELYRKHANSILLLQTRNFDPEPITRNRSLSLNDCKTIA